MRVIIGKIIHRHRLLGGRLHHSATNLQHLKHMLASMELKGSGISHKPKHKKIAL